MPIKLACKCGQRLAVKDSLAGKAVKCPRCSKVLRIPQPQPIPAAPPTSQKTASSISDLLDEAGLTQVKPGTYCPSCRTFMSADAVVCVKCGFNKNLGRRMETKIEQPPEEPRRKRKSATSTVPGWAYAAALGGLALLVGGAWLLNPFLAATLLWTLGSGTSSIGGIWLLVIAFQDEVMHGILCLLFSPLYSLYYIITHWEECKLPFFLQLAGSGLVALGVVVFLASAL